MTKQVAFSIVSLQLIVCPYYGAHCGGLLLADSKCRTKWFFALYLETKKRNIDKAERDTFLCTLQGKKGASNCAALTDFKSDKVEALIGIVLLCKPNTICHVLKEAKTCKTCLLLFSTLLIFHQSCLMALRQEFAMPINVNFKREFLLCVCHDEWFSSAVVL